MKDVRYEAGKHHPADHFVYRIDDATGRRTPYAQAFTPEAARRIADLLTRDAAMTAASSLADTTARTVEGVRAARARGLDRAQTAVAHGPNVVIRQAGGDVNG